MNLETATFAGGCFWCTEAIFKRLRGVESVLPGYSGGFVENPTYEQVCSGNTGHAESIQIEFKPEVISYEKLLEIFFHLHDPTTLNRQGNDVGSQYRSIIFYHDVRQKELAERVRDKIADEGVYHDPILTEIVPFEKFYLAEDYHENYYERNKDKPYCQYVIDPKLQKLVKGYSKDLKSSDEA